MSLKVLRGAVLLSVIAALCFAAHLNSGATSLILLVTLAFHSLDTRFTEAAALALVAVGIIDFFFIEPLFTFTVTDPADAIALLSFLLTSLIVTRIQAQTRLQRTNAENLYRVSQTLVLLPPEETLGTQFLESVCTAFNCAAVSLYDGKLGRTTSVGAVSPALERETRLTFTAGVDATSGDSGIVTRCLRTRGENIGALGFSGLLSRDALPAILALTATGLDRASAFGKARTEALNAEAEVLRSAILDALAHEFKIPLSTVMTAAGGLSATGDLNEKQTELAGLIESESERLSDVTNRLLRLARLDRDEVRPQMEIADLGALTGTVVQRQRSIWPNRHVKAGEPALRMQVMVDSELIRLVLTQLIDNACRYSKTGSPIEVETGGAGDRVSVTVRNIGPAIPADEQERIFNRFYRGERARQSASGSGLGLYVARKIAVAHAGTLELIGTDSDYVVFRLTLPRHAE